MARPGRGKRVLERSDHISCADGTTISGHHLWFSNMMMRAFIREHGLVTLEVSFCKKCHEELSEQIVVVSRASEAPSQSPSSHRSSGPHPAPRRSR